jgi:CDGSH-type Zn-finger protein
VTPHTATPAAGYTGSTRGGRVSNRAAWVPSREMDEDATITPYRDGPLLVRGPFRLSDQDGNEIEIGRRTVALCRCGKSRMRPFCDGTHKIIRFSAPSGVEQR